MKGEFLEQIAKQFQSELLYNVNQLPIALLLRVIQAVEHFALFEY